jgi:transposase
MSKVMAGIDLHSNNVLVGLVDEEGRRLGHRKLNCDLEQIVTFLAPYRERLGCVAIESTFNWYWLVDGLRDRGYPAVLANPAKMDQYSGIKHADDKNDAYFLAELSRLKILPTGYVYDPHLRPVRDLLRRRMHLVRQRTALLLSFKNLYIRTTGQTLPLGQVKAMEPKEALKLYEHPANQLIAEVQKRHIDELTASIGRIEKVVLRVARKLPYYSGLKTLPGVGIVLGLTITMEVGDIGRFKEAGHFASYCRAVDSQRISNGKRKGDNNQKSGNKYLAWAFVEAAQMSRRSDPSCRQWYERKAARTGTVVATKALACKLAKAAWHVMAEGGGYQAHRMFPDPARPKAKEELGKPASARNGVGVEP